MPVYQDVHLLCCNGSSVSKASLVLRFRSEAAARPQTRMRTTTFSQAAEALSPRRTTQADWLARSTTTFSVVGDDFVSSRSSPRALGCLPKGGSSHVPSLLLTAEAFLRSGRIPGPTNVAKYHYERPHVDSDPPPPPGSIASARGEYAPLKLEQADLSAIRKKQAAELARIKAEEEDADKWYDAYLVRKAQTEEQQRQRAIEEKMAAERAAVEREAKRREASNKLDKELKERRARLAAEREAVDKALIQQKVELDRMKDEAKKSARRGGK